MAVSAATVRSARSPEAPAAAAAQTASLARCLAGEALGTALLLAAVVGSGIMAERLSGGNAALALLANTLATAAALAVAILMFQPVSGAHFNPVVTLAFALRRELPWSQVPGYVGAQLAGAVAGTLAAHVMFAAPLIAFSHHARTGAPQWFSEAVATFGLLAVILACARHSARAMPAAVGCYIGAAYWFTASTAFANPAVTLARCLTDSFAGIRPADVAPFVLAQLVGALAAVAVFGWLLRPPPAADTARPV